MGVNFDIGTISKTGQIQKNRNSRKRHCTRKALYTKTEKWIDSPPIDNPPGKSALRSTSVVAMVWYNVTLMIQKIVEQQNFTLKDNESYRH